MNIARPRRSDVTAAAIEASAIAGPVFAAWMVATNVTGTYAVDINIGQLIGFVAFLVLTVPFGFLLAIGPCWVLAHACISVDRMDDGLPDPGLWLVAGTASAAGLGWLLDFGEHTVSLALTGACCAMFARKRALDRANA
ncbi:hypothetical protein [Sphingomicrobium sediminis]|uniref:Uncharacterized protein n=1 Tax=Sphingomicrobium sediminis TaxID=2950949 RepID=A0A9X2EG20_9SPHN|nr:hypothetical protein [Sphingomicrobium sediminis]MCM8556837.1 hypothetical protein [Sphingomicrobium sediminis]